MRKFALDLDRLEIETFEVLPDPLEQRSGTVAAYQQTASPDDATCEHSCQGYTCLTCDQARNTNCVCWPDDRTVYTCYQACDPNWTAAASCQANESCGMSCDGSCNTQWC